MYEWAYPTICGKLLGDRIKTKEACEASCWLCEGGLTADAKAHELEARNLCIPIWLRECV